MKKNISALRRKKRADFKAKNMILVHNKIICNFVKTNNHLYVNLYNSLYNQISINTFKYKKEEPTVKKYNLMNKIAQDFYKDIIKNYGEIDIKDIYFNIRQNRYQGNIKIFIESLKLCFINNMKNIIK